MGGGGGGASGAKGCRRVRALLFSGLGFRV